MRRAKTPNGMSSQASASIATSVDVAELRVAWLSSSHWASHRNGGALTRGTGPRLPASS